MHRYGTVPGFYVTLTILMKINRIKKKEKRTIKHEK
jgi:hypothetical protein